jgi:5'-nucleotidase
MTSPILTKDFQEKARQLFLKYYPIEMSTTLSQEEKIPFMEEWYSNFYSSTNLSIYLSIYLSM